jgi:hypothetical protein
MTCANDGVWVSHDWYMYLFLIFLSKFYFCLISEFKQIYFNINVHAMSTIILLFTKTRPFLVHNLFLLFIIFNSSTIYISYRMLSYEGREGEIKYRKKSSKKNLKHINLFDMRNRMWGSSFVGMWNVLFSSRYQISWFLGHLEVRIWFKNSSFQPDLSIYRRREYFDTI